MRKDEEMKLEELSIQEVSEIISVERRIDELGRLSIPIKQRQFLEWKEKDKIICQLGEDEKSLVLKKMLNIDKSKDMI